MKKIWTGLAMAFGLAAAAAESAEACSQRQINMRQRADVAIDAKTGTVLYGMNETTPFYQASLTKRMVQLLTYEAIRDGRLTKGQLIDLTENYFRNAAGHPQYSDAIPFNYHQVSVEDAVTAMMLRSSNRAPLALGVAIAGSEEEFVQRMNERARELGMNNTRFINPAGYPTRKAEQEHRTTALDHATLVREILLKFPEEVDDLNRVSALLTGYTQSGRAGSFEVGSTNALMPEKHTAYSLSNVTGGKTGYACAAGFALDVEAEIDGRSVIVVTGGQDSPAMRNRTAYNLIANRDQVFMARLEQSRLLDQQFDALNAIEALTNTRDRLYPDFNTASYLNMDLLMQDYAFMRPAGFFTPRFSFQQDYSDDYSQNILRDYSTGASTIATSFSQYFNPEPLPRWQY